MQVLNHWMEPLIINKHKGACPPENLLCSILDTVGLFDCIFMTCQKIKNLRNFLKDYSCSHVVVCCIRHFFYFFRVVSTVRYKSLRKSENVQLIHIKGRLSHGSAQISSTICCINLWSYHRFTFPYSSKFLFRKQLWRYVWCTTLATAFHWRLCHAPSSSWSISGKGNYVVFLCLLLV